MLVVIEGSQRRVRFRSTFNDRRTEDWWLSVTASTLRKLVTRHFLDSGFQFCNKLILDTETPRMTTPGIRAFHLPEEYLSEILISPTYCSSLNRPRSSFLKMLHRSILNKALDFILYPELVPICPLIVSASIHSFSSQVLSSNKKSSCLVFRTPCCLLANFAHLFLLWPYAFCRYTPNVGPGSGVWEWITVFIRIIDMISCYSCCLWEIKSYVALYSESHWSSNGVAWGVS